MRHRMSLNISLNLVGTVIAAVVGFVTLPFMIRQLGVESYGLWTLIAAATSYFATLDLGVSGSLGRVIAGRRANDDIEAINRFMSTGLALLSVIGLLMLPVCFLGAHVFVSTFHNATHDSEDVRLAFVIASFSTLLAFPTSVFNALIWGYERFDIENAIEIPVLVARAAVILALVRPEIPLTELALILLAFNVLSMIASAVLCWRVEPRLKLGWRQVRIAAIRPIYAFGLWYWLLGMARNLTPQVGPLLIGFMLGNAAVTTFAIARQLVIYGNSVVMAASRVAAPRAAVQHFAGHDGVQQRLLIDGGQYSFGLALALAGGLISLGYPFIELWQGVRGDGAYLVLVALILGEIVPMSQWVTAAILSSMGQNARLVALALGETLLSLLLMLLVIQPFGLLGVCIAISLSALLFRGVLLLLCGCQALGVGVGRYVARTFAPVLLAALAPMVAGIWCAYALSPRTVASFVLAASIFGALQAAFLAPFLFRSLLEGRDRTPSWLVGARKFLSRWQSSFGARFRPENRLRGGVPAPIFLLRARLLAARTQAPPPEDALAPGERP